MGVECSAWGMVVICRPCGNFHRRQGKRTDCGNASAFGKNIGNVQMNGIVDIAKCLLGGSDCSCERLPMHSQLISFGLNFSLRRKDCQVPYYHRQYPSFAQQVRWGLIE